MLEEQARQALCNKLCDEWAAVGRSTEPADRAEAERAMNDLYALNGAKPPQAVWADSPVAGALAAEDIARDDGRHGVFRPVWTQRSLIQSRIFDSVNYSIPSRRAAWDAGVFWVNNPLNRRLNETTAEPIRQAVDEAVEIAAPRRSITRPFGSPRYRDWADFALRPEQEVAIIATLDATCQIAEMPIPSQLDALLRLFRASGWCWPLNNGTVVFSERPQIMRRDARGLHCADGPAVRYADGFSVYAWHGVRIPEALLAGKTTASAILGGWPAEPDQRRAAIEIMGWDRFIAEAKLTKVGRTVKDPANPGHDLSLYSLPWDLFHADLRVVLCDNATPERDGTRRRFGLTVPADLSDPVSAAAWTFDLTASGYRQLQHAY